MKRRPYHAGWVSLASLASLALVIFSAPNARGQTGPAPASSAAGTAARESGPEPSTYGASLPRGKKLILTDGSFQLVREYEKQGDRVRYYSVERSAWEEIPAEMVDWAATEKAGAETAAAEKENLERLHAAAAMEVSSTIDTGSSLLIGSGVFLPDSPGFYVLDGQTVLGLIQVEATSRLDKGRAILKGLSGIPVISSKRIIEVPGKRAKVRIQSPEPEFFFRTVDGRSPQVILVQADVNGDKRRVSTAVIDMVGTTKYEQKEVPVLASEAARGVLRLAMTQKLKPGEYALLETTPEGLNSYVWEFGVDAAPSANGSKTSRAAPAKSNGK